MLVVAIRLFMATHRGLLAVLSVAGAFACHDAIVVVGESPSDASAPKSLQSTTPVFNGTAIAATTPPRPMAGGTLITLAMPNAVPLAVASDPDEDAVDVVALGASPHFVGQVLLQPGDEPGRLVADAAGRVHVVLRGGGAIATIYPTGPSLLDRQAVCSAPRGIDYIAATDSIVVACATGELMVLPASGGAATLSVVLDRDFHDVVVDGSTLYVTRFRSAEVLVLDMGGNILSRSTPSVPAGSLPDVAWRAVHNPNGGVSLLHQIASTQTVVVDAVPPHVTTPPPASYGSNPNPTDPEQPTVPVVIAAVSTINTFDSNAAMGLNGNPVIDLAMTSDGMFEALDLLGAIEIGTQQSGATTLNVVSQGDIPSAAPDEFVAIADARASANAIVLQRRSSVAALIVIPTTANPGPPPLPPPDHDPIQNVTIPLPQRAAHVDTGFDVFHVPTSAGVACMNCHPEGGDDGHTWKFEIKNQMQVRRTQNLRGGVVLNSAPYHWTGDIPDIQTICDEIFTHRMGGGSVLAPQTALLGRFLDSIPRVPVYAGLDPSAVEQGSMIFYGIGGCSSCHAGPTGTSPSNLDVGKIDSLGFDSPVKIPMLLGVADRAPYLHDGCAATLMDRLTNPKCAGSNHGNTAALDQGQLANLEQFLESL